MTNRQIVAHLSPLENYTFLTPCIEIDKSNLMRFSDGAIAVSSSNATPVTSVVPAPVDRVDYEEIKPSRLPESGNRRRTPTPELKLETELRFR